ncbi:sulfate permease [Pseudotabrizicola sp. 4114]|uniref:SulP family inorganic anion transporter n=1 Tax=Pseudotabrizicola sp. 4114 TaxID=2817731 RepID=UPI00285D69D7|nr:SulP family sulfate permease [Pseudorhodobacter sp. 4114]
MRRYFPILDWLAVYDKPTFGADLMAALIVTIMLIPQSLAYALLAGLPAEVGLYASIAPLLVYAVFGTSRTLAVGPVAVVSLMTAAAVGQIAAQGTAEYLGAAIAMAVLSGLILLCMGLLRLGFIANFLSHPVISGFISASAVLIAVGQLPGILGIAAPGHTLVAVATGILTGISGLNPVTLLIGGFALGFLWWARTRLKAALLRAGVRPGLAGVIVRAAPVLAVALTTLATWGFGLAAHGVAVVGDIPTGLPMPALPPLDPALWQAILLPAALISLVGYVETVSVAQTLAAKRRQRIDPDQELVALGAANIGAGLSGGFPVTGGFARSVVNFDAGAQTPAAGAFTALAMALATLFLTPLLSHLPKATLAATIIVAVLGLVDLAAIRRVWASNRADFAAMAATILLTLLVGVEAGIAAGVALSILLHLYRTSQPHVAVIGQVQGTEHFRNVRRHTVTTVPDVLALRIDEALYFPNARFLEDTLLGAVAEDKAIRHIVLNCVAVNDIDSSAVESLEAINARLHDAGVQLHLAEVKGPVMDRLLRTHLLHDLTGAVHLTMYDAMLALAPQAARDCRALPRCETAKP